MSENRKKPPEGAICQEASPLSHKTYIPCGRPAVVIVEFKARGEGPYNMCVGCAAHNVPRRGASYVLES